MKKTILIISILLITLSTQDSAFSQEAKPVAQNPSASAITAKPNKNKTLDVKNPLGVAYAENIISKTELYIKSNNYISAKQTLDLISEWVSDAAEYHADIFKSIKKTENADIQANIERDLAIKFATMRDKILYLNAKILVHNGDYKNAVSNLVEVIKSQPNTELGFQSYKILQNIGFTYSVDTIQVKTDPIQPTE